MHACMACVKERTPLTVSPKRQVSSGRARRDGVDTSAQAGGGTAW
jgi:hypothetical protein